MGGNANHAPYHPCFTLPLKKSGIPLPVCPKKGNFAAYIACFQAHSVQLPRKIQPTPGTNRPPQPLLIRFPIPSDGRIYYMTRIKRLKKIRLHREGTNTLILTLGTYAVVNGLLYFLLREGNLWPFYIVCAITTVLCAIIINFFRCPIRLFNGETKDTVVAAADGKVVVIEEVEENEYFHDRRLMVSIFMSVTNVHANWFPVDGYVKMVRHHNGNFHKAWLPKASCENERSTIVIETPDGQEVLVRQVAGAVARRIVTYAAEGEDCYIDEHLGFIKFGSRVDVYLPLDTQIDVKVGQPTVGNQTIIGHLKP